MKCLSILSKIIVLIIIVGFIILESFSGQAFAQNTLLDHIRLVQKKLTEIRPLAEEIGYTLKAFETETVTEEQFRTFLDAVQPYEDVLHSQTGVLQAMDSAVVFTLELIQDSLAVSCNTEYTKEIQNEYQRVGEILAVRVDNFQHYAMLLKEQEERIQQNLQKWQTFKGQIDDTYLHQKAEDIKRTTMVSWNFQTGL